MKGNNFNFGQRVKQLLEEREISTKKFLEGTGTPNQRFYDWVNKGCLPNVLTAMKIAHFFNMTVEQLVTGSTKSPLADVVENLQDRLNSIRKLCS